MCGLTDSCIITLILDTGNECVGLWSGIMILLLDTGNTLCWGCFV